MQYIPVNPTSVGWIRSLVPCKTKKMLVRPIFATLRDEFYIDNVSSTRLQHGTAQNILTVRQLNESLVRGLARAWKLKKLLEKGLTTRELEKASGMNKRNFARYIHLCYLSPRIVADILEYKNPRKLTLKELMNLAEGHVDFEKQEQNWQGN